jgi:hypothetical protein
MPREQSSISATTQPSHGYMTHAEVVAFFDRRQIAFDNLDAATLAADYADDCIVDSPTGGTHIVSRHENPDRQPGHRRQ